MTALNPVTPVSSAPVQRAADKLAGSGRIRTIAFVAVIAFLVLAPAVVPPAFLMKAMCFAIFACAFNLLLGYVGMLPFGHAAFFGVASYVAAHAAKGWGWSPELVIILGAVVATVLGALIGFIAIRRQGIYFAMITLALAQLVYFVCVQAPSFTGGEDGIHSVPRGALFGLIDVRRARTASTACRAARCSA
jgi:branched-chain amino acid transport system permease protein